MSIAPPLPRRASTEFARVSPARQLTFDAVGRFSPVGNTVRWPSARVSVTVTVSAAAEASAGTPHRPATTTRRMPGATCVIPERWRVSASRHGPTAVYAAPAVGGAATASIGAGTTDAGA